MFIFPKNVDAGVLVCGEGTTELLVINQLADPVRSLGPASQPHRPEPACGWITIMRQNIYSGPDLWGVGILSPLFSSSGSRFNFLAKADPDTGNIIMML